MYSLSKRERGERKGGSSHLLEEREDNIFCMVLYRTLPRLWMFEVVWIEEYDMVVVVGSGSRQ